MSRQREPAPRGHVRIVGGRWRGTRLAVADAPGLRPSADRVRETLFNWLQPVIGGARVLDLFAGSGALGIEALSRGAREALLVERDPRLASHLQATIDRLQANDQATVACADALALLDMPLQGMPLQGRPLQGRPLHGRFDIVFVDPPFDAGLWQSVLARLPHWLAHDAWLYLEAPVDASVAPGAGWVAHREGSTRQVRYALFRRAPGAAATLAADSPADGTATQ